MNRKIEAILEEMVQRRRSLYERAAELMAVGGSAADDADQRYVDLLQAKLELERERERT